MVTEIITSHRGRTNLRKLIVGGLGSFDLKSIFLCGSGEPVINALMEGRHENEHDLKALYILQKEIGKERNIRRVKTIKKLTSVRKRGGF